MSPSRSSILLVCLLAGCKPESAETPAPSIKAVKAPSTPSAAKVETPVPKKALPRKELDITIPNRSVHASVPDPGDIRGENGAVTVTSGTHRVTIGVRRIMVDGTEMTQIPEDTREMQVAIDDAGILSVRSGEALVGTLDLSTLPPPGE